ncbi:ABC transporter ATP-binding protein [Caldimonas brevitalea]|uniref:NitT/TauT family transport system ATP-binding protein n=1 Tax=Caldimonas brevitalea TaxID=413882 RepID=A0A0G3BY15_9BURK|nr:ABC transporter ATP-binding protein [Caldimonas brevitalea]AKJ31435.1 NitT/TauT family transport system ATP-binding protein [Caldimonas brevitalea]
MSPPLIEARHLDKRFATGTLAVRDLNLHVEAGEFVSLLGPSGCGKSTVLRLVAGLEQPSRGRLRLPKAEAAVGYVFQEPTLMPWASVFDNVWLPLRIAGCTRERARDRIDTLLQSVGLQGFAHAFPAELSGGMKMRASIARALVRQPVLLLMDEPFAALDEITRQKLNDDLLAWWRTGGFTSLFVTHSVFEAVYLSQRVLVMSHRPGHIVEEVHVEQPYPRHSAWRTSSDYVQTCARVSQALERAQTEVAR